MIISGIKSNGKSLHNNVIFFFHLNLEFLTQEIIHTFQCWKRYLYNNKLEYLNDFKTLNITLYYANVSFVIPWQHGVTMVTAFSYHGDSM